jgi:hypothetical protein
MPVHENKFGTNQNDEYNLEGVRSEHSGSAPDWHTAVWLRDIALLSLP